MLSVVVPLDGSVSRYARPDARELAQRSTGRIVLLKAAHAPRGNGPSTAGQSIDRYQHAPSDLVDLVASWVPWKRRLSR